LIESELQVVKAALLSRSPFFGYLLLRCNFRLDDRLRYPAASD